VLRILAGSTVLQLIGGGPGQIEGVVEFAVGQQPGTPVYATDYDAEGIRRALAEASPERKPEWRGTARSPGTFESPA